MIRSKSFLGNVVGMVFFAIFSSFAPSVSYAQDTSNQSKAKLIQLVKFPLTQTKMSESGFAQVEQKKAYLDESDIDKVFPWKFPVIPYKGGGADWDFPTQLDVIQANLKKFFGTATGDYVEMTPDPEDKTGARRINLYNQFIWASVRADEAYLLPNGNRLLVSFQYNDIGTRTIVVTSGNSSQVLAAALIHRFCGKDNLKELKTPPKDHLLGCDKNPTMTIFYSGRIAPNVEINDQLNEFAIRYVQRYNYRIANQIASWNRIEKLSTEVRVVDGK